MDYNEYDSAKFKFELQREFSDWFEDFDKEDNVVFGEDWREKVYAGEVDVPDVGFAWDKEHFLVGHGEKTRVECGSFKRFLVCLRLKNHAGMKVDGVDYTNKIYHKRQWWYCKKPECPVCFKKGWAVNEAGRAEARLKYASDRLKMKSEHIIVRPKQDLDVPFEKLKKMTLQAMLVRGIVGGVLIYHHFRYRNKEVARRTGLPVGWFKAFHFHVVGFIKGGYGNCRTCAYQKNKTFAKCRECNGFEGVTRRAYDKDGFIVKVKEERKTVGGTVWYQLSHASLKRGAKKHIVANWFGVCGRNKLKIPKGALPQKENLCKICGEPLYHGHYHGNLREYLAILDAMGIRRSDGVIADMYDENGKVKWSAVHGQAG